MRTEAIIIKKQYSGEYNQLVSCFTKEYGKVVAVAKSILKPTSIQAMHLDTANLVSLELINGRTVPIIAGAQCEKLYLNMRQSLDRMAVAYFFLEVLDKTFYDLQKDIGIWDFYAELFDHLDQPVTINIQAYFREQQAELLKLLGYKDNGKLPSQAIAKFSDVDAVFEQITNKRFLSSIFFDQIELETVV